MGFKSKRNTVKLILNLLDGKTSNKAVVEMPPQKPFVAGNKAEGAHLPRASEQQIGKYKSYYESFLNEAILDKTIAPHNIIVVRDGLVVAERSYGAYRMDKWNTTYSMSKTLCGMAIGFLVDEGKLSLEDKITKIFAKRNIIPSLGMLSVTIKQVLNMTSGSTFNETGSVTSDSWISDYLTGNTMYEPGTQFNYNSMNSFMLGAVVKEITGLGLVEFLTPRLFNPLGITDVYWELNPEGIEKGGWGLYILPEDMAKLGLLILNKGKYNGKQILSEQWTVMASSTPPSRPIQPSQG